MTFSSKEILSSVFAASLLIVIILTFASFGILKLSYLVIVPFIFFSAIFKNDLIIIYYLIILPTAGIIPSSLNFLEAFGLDEFVNLMMLTYLVLKKRVSSASDRRNYQGIGLIIIMIAIINLTNLKNAIFEMYEGSWDIFFKRIPFTLLKHIPLILLLTRLKELRIRQSMVIGVFLSAILIVISQYFTVELTSLNLVTFDESEFEGLAANIDHVNRFSGFYDGDPNSAGIYLLMVIGYIFTILEKKGKGRIAYYLLFIFLLIGVLLSASRTVIVAFGLIALLYLFNNRNQRSSFKILAFLLVLGFLKQDFVLNQLSRFHNAHYQVSTEVEGNRIVKWYLYMVYMLESPLYIFTGAQKEILIRSAHNVYIQAFYNVGIVPVIAFVSKLRSFISVSVRKNKKAYYIILPFLCITMYVGELKELPLFVILLLLVYTENEYETLQLNKTSH